MAPPEDGAGFDLDALEDGVVLVAEGRVRGLNVAAGVLLQVDRARAVGAPLMGVLRDHRLERAYVEQQRSELVTRGRSLVVRPFPGGIVLRDVTAMRRAQDDARELLAVLSHELRTPVTAIRTALEALRHDLPDEQRRRFLDRAEAEALRLTRLLEDLTVDTTPPAARSVTLEETLARVETALLGTLRAHEVRLEAEPDDVELWCDPDKLVQVLVNLIENAAVHGPDGAVIRVEAARERERPGWWRVEVRDAGAPLEPASIDGLFSPHARGGGASGRGTGLGLYVVRSIAERWGGRAYGRALAGGNAFGFTVPGDRDAARG